MIKYNTYHEGKSICISKKTDVKLKIKYIMSYCFALLILE